MQCEGSDCTQDARVHVTVSLGGEKRETHWCAPCAELRGIPCESSDYVPHPDMCPPPSLQQRTDPVPSLQQRLEQAEAEVRRCHALAREWAKDGEYERLNDGTYCEHNAVLRRCARQILDG